MFTEHVKQQLAVAAGIVRRYSQEERQPIALSTTETAALASALLDCANLLAVPLQGTGHVAALEASSTLLPAELVLGDSAPCNHLVHLQAVLQSDLDITTITDINYRGSWKRRGGTGAFHMLARKWDRLEPRIDKYGFDVFEACERDTRREGAIDDVRDLRRYLALVEAELIRRGKVSLQTLHKDSEVPLVAKSPAPSAATGHW